jgi:putative peptidoglycan lipid II flippase
VPFLHAYAIAAANGAGIVTAAVLLLVGLRGRIVAVSLRSVGEAAARLAAAAAGAGALGFLAGHAMAGLPQIVTAVLGGLVVLAVFAGLARLFGVDEVTEVAQLVKRRIHHGR